jgi:hypothetical protein
MLTYADVCYVRYGQFVLMLIEMIQQDILKFMYIYVMCLVLFSHMLNVIMDKQNSGWQVLSKASKASKIALL